MNHHCKNEKKIKWHKRHVTIDTPCYMEEVESIIRAVSDQGWATTAEITVDDDKIVITYGKEEK